MSAKPLILFDLVSTLTQAGPRYVQAYIRMCQAWDVTPPAAEDIMQALGEKNLKQIIAEFTPTLPAEHIAKFMSDCNQACDALLQDKSWEEDLYPHAREALWALHKADYALGIYTGTRETSLRAQLEYHELNELFDPAYLRAKDNVRDGHMDSATLKASQLASLIKAHDARGPVIIIGDSPADFKAAQKAGSLFIGFVATPAAAQKMRDAGATHLFSNYADLPDLITRICREFSPSQNGPSAAPSHKFQQR